MIPFTILGMYIYHSSQELILFQVQKATLHEMIQIKENVTQKVKIIDEFARTVSYNKKIRLFIENEYQDNANDVINYKTEIIQYIEDLITLNASLYNSLRFYHTNPTIPDTWDYFYQLSVIDNIPDIKKNINDVAVSQWWEAAHPDRLMSGMHDEIFSFFVKVQATDYKRLLALFEVGIKKDVMFDGIYKANKEQIGNVYVIDNNNNVIYTSQPDIPAKNLNSVLKTNKALIANDIQSVVDINGSKCILTIRVLDEINCRLVSIVPVSRFNSALNKDKIKVYMTVVCIFVICYILFHLMNFNLLKRLKDLVNAMKRAQNGEFKIKVSSSSNDEIGKLMDNFNYMIVKINELIETTYKAEIAEKDAEMKALEAQINPHFLFNTLSAISWTAKRDKNNQIVEITNALAEIYRYIMYNDKFVVTVREEIGNLSSYIKIQEMRFRGELDFYMDIDDAIMECSILKLILQPIVENAVVHGLSPKMNHGTVIVRAKRDNQDILFEIIDDGMGIEQDILNMINENKHINSKFGGYAIKNVNDRIKLYYGNQYGISVFSKRGIGTSVYLSIPSGGKLSS